MPINDAYRPNTNKMVCICPYLVTSCFLLCKHLMQGVQPVPPRFFLKVRQQRKAPFWRHPSLKPLPNFINSTEPGDYKSGGHNSEKGHDKPGLIDDDIERGNSYKDNSDDDSDEDGNFIDVGRENGHFFDEMVEEGIHTIQEFADSLGYQCQFHDGCMLCALECEGSGFKRLMTACLTKERWMRNIRGTWPSMWEQKTSSAMFYHSRPACQSDFDT